jgi:hypothetical protein
MPAPTTPVIDWPALYFIVQVLGFIGIIITIMTATHKITKKFTGIEKDIEYLQKTVDKHENKLEEFAVNYKTDILVRRAREELEKVEESKERIKDG